MCICLIYIINSSEIRWYLSFLKYIKLLYFSHACWLFVYLWSNVYVCPLPPFHLGYIFVYVILDIKPLLDVWFEKNFAHFWLSFSFIYLGIGDFFFFSTQHGTFIFNVISVQQEYESNLFINGNVVTRRKWQNQTSVWCEFITLCFKWYWEFNAGMLNHWAKPPALYNFCFETGSH